MTMLSNLDRNESKANHCIAVNGMRLAKSKNQPPFLKSLLVLAIMKTKNQKRWLKCVGRSERAEGPKKTSKLLHNSLMLKSVQVVVFACCKLCVRAGCTHSWLAKF